MARFHAAVTPPSRMVDTHHATVEPLFDHGRLPRTLDQGQERMDKRLEQALRTLRAIQQRYETGSAAGSGYVRSYTVQVALGYADVLWIAAVIEALEKPTATSQSEETNRLHWMTHFCLSADSSAQPEASGQQQLPPQPLSSRSSSPASAAGAR